MARPPSYNQKIHCALAKKLATKGYTDVEIADTIGISERSLNYWKERYPEFLQSIKEGKRIPDDRVEKSLYKNAVGYNYKAHKPMSISDGNGEGSHIEIVEYTEHIPAQTVAQIFWLKNRRPAQWRDKQEVEHSGEITETKKYDLSKLSDEELKMLDDATKKI
jgi:hypothetical protein